MFGIQYAQSAAMIWSLRGQGLHVDIFVGAVQGPNPLLSFQQPAWSTSIMVGRCEAVCQQALAKMIDKEES